MEKSEQNLKKLVVKQRIKKILFRLILVALVIVMFTFFYSHYIFIYARGVVTGEEVMYSAPIDGTIADVKVDLYERVKSQQPLIHIHSRELELKKTRLEQHIADLETALEIKKSLETETDIDSKIISLKNSIDTLEQEIEVLETTLESQQERADIAKDAYERAERLVSLEAATERLAENRHILYIISEANVADARVRISSRKAELKTKKEQLALLEEKRALLDEQSPAAYSNISLAIQEKRAELAEVKEQLQQGIIRATAPCTIDKLYKSPDAYVLEGTAVLKAIRLDKPCVVAYVEPSHLRKLQEGQAAVMIFPKKKIQGTIKEISDKLDPLPGMFRTPFRVRHNYGKVKIIPRPGEYPPELFKPGLQVKVRFLKSLS